MTHDGFKVRDATILDVETARVLYDDADDWAKQVAARIRALASEPQR